MNWLYFAVCALLLNIAFGDEEKVCNLVFAPNLQHVCDFNRLSEIENKSQIGALVLKNQRTLFVCHSPIFKEFSNLFLLANNDGFFTEIGKECFEGLRLWGLFFTRNRITEIDLSGINPVRLTSLTLSENQLRKINFAGLHFPTLSMIKLSDNNLEELVINEDNLPIVGILQAQYNSISKIQIKSSKLNILDLTNNSMTSFEDSNLETNNLMLLFLRNNQLTSLTTKMLGNSTQLNKVLFEGNPIKTVDLKHFNIREITLSWNYLLLNSTSQTNIVTVGLYMVDVIKLDMSHNKISNISLSGTSANWNVQELYLNNNEIAEVNSMKWLPKLVTIDLSFNKITTIGDQAFDRLPNLRSLKLNNNYLQIIPNSVLQQTALISIDLSEQSTEKPTKSRI